MVLMAHILNYLDILQPQQLCCAEVSESEYRNADLRAVKAPLANSVDLDRRLVARFGPYAQ